MLCNHNQDNFGCRLEKIDGKKKEKNKFSNARFFIDDHLLKNGWKLTITCTKKDCIHGGQHWSMQSASRCLMSFEKKEKEKVKKREWAAKQPSVENKCLEAVQNYQQFVLAGVAKLPEGLVSSKKTLSSAFSDFFKSFCHREFPNVGQIGLLGTLSFRMINVSIYKSELDCLEEKEFLVDSIIDFVNG